ncbi:MAG: hypothetical protein IJZ39_11010 [Oscillospiraceae bacterium]|nr:hypothetical protein [Oscillospiraceae bacterium]
MVGSYDVRMGDRPVGTVKVEKEGLYYRFSCRCSLSGEVLCRLWLRSGGKEIDLGLCVPMEAGFGTEKRMPVRQCGEDAPEFFLRPKGADTRGNFVPISPEEPFRYLHRLENAFLERRGSRLGIVIR